MSEAQAASASVAPGPGSDQLQVSSESAAPYRITQTEPDELKRHSISDEELTIVSSMNVDRTWEIMWAAIGVAIGSGPTCFSALKDFLWASPPVEITGGGLFHIVAFSVAIVLAIAFWRICRNRTTPVAGLVAEIRARKKRAVA